MESMESGKKAGGESQLVAQPTSVLLGDDEEALRRVLRTLLTVHGYFTYEAGTGEQVLQTVPSLRPDVILLDLGLPDMDGIEVIHRLRRAILTPIIILSVRSAESDKIAALNARADDYLTKPCSLAELLDRIRAALLGQGVRSDQVFVAGDLRIDLNHQTVQIGTPRVDLTPNEFDVLEVLVRNAGRLLTQQRLVQEAWGQGRLPLLQATIASPRQKLDFDPARPRHISTEPAVGYRLRIQL